MKNTSRAILVICAISCSSSDTSKPSVPYNGRITEIKKVDQGCQYLIQWGASTDNKSDVKKLSYTIYMADTNDRNLAPKGWTKISENIVGETKAANIVEAPSNDHYFFITGKDEAGNESAPSAGISLKPCTLTPLEDENPEEDYRKKETKSAESTAGKLEKARQEAQKNGKNASSTGREAAPNGGITTREKNGSVTGSEPSSAKNEGAGDPPKSPETVVVPGTGNYWQFGLVENKSPAVFRFDPMDDPVYTVNRDAAAKDIDACTSQTLAGSNYIGRPEVQFVNNYTTALQGNVGARNVYVQTSVSPSAGALYLLKTGFSKTAEGPTNKYEVLFTVAENFSIQQQAMMDAAFEVADHVNYVALQNKIVSEASKKLVEFLSVDPEDEILGIKVPTANQDTSDVKTIVDDLNIKTNDAATPKVNAPLNMFVQDCHMHRVLIGDFSALRAKNKQFKYGLTTMQLHPDQRTYPGLILDSDIFIDIQSIKTDTSDDAQALKLFQWTLARQLLFALGADGNHSEKQPSLLSGELEKDKFGDLNWKFAEDSYEAAVLLYMYGKYSKTELPDLLNPTKHSWGLVRDVVKAK